MKEKSPEEIAQRVLESYFLGLGKEVPSLLLGIAEAIQAERERFLKAVP